MNIQDKVISMYNEIPFPDYGDNPLEKAYIAQKRYIDLSLGFKGSGYGVYNEKNVLDGGCGTGRESMYMASQYAKVTAIDLTQKSLTVAQKQSKKEKLKYPIRFIRTSVLNIPIKSNSFDLVLSSGVTHHTADPERAFSELVRVLKPGGFFVFYVYNNYAHMISNLRRAIVNIFAGEDVHKRVVIAKRIFPLYNRRHNLAHIYDEFGHPHKSEHSISEVLLWFEKYGIQYESVYPKFGIRGLYQSIKKKSEFLVDGKFKPTDGKLNIPSAINILTSNIAQLIRGFVSYSGGYRFMGIKKTAM